MFGVGDPDEQADFGQPRVTAEKAQPAADDIERPGIDDARDGAQRRPAIRRGHGR
jgi:hypothetical protein